MDHKPMDILSVISHPRGDMIITGIGNVYENAELKYRQVPITVHLMGKEHVLGLIMDAVKTDRHFLSNMKCLAP
jgi:hypothetical protein